MPDIAAGKPSKVKTRDFEQVSQILRAQKSKKETQEPTIFDAVMALRKEIQELREKGYYFTEIAAILNENGIEVAPATLRQYMRQPQRKKSGTPKNKNRTQAATTVSDETQATPPEAPTQQGERVIPAPQAAVDAQRTQAVSLSPQPQSPLPLVEEEQANRLRRMGSR